MHFVVNNSNGKIKLDGHLPLNNEKGIYNDLRNLLAPGMTTEEDVYEFMPVTRPKNENILKLNDFSTTLSCPCRKLDWVEGDMKLWFLMSANSHGLESLTIYCENNVLTFDLGGQVQNKKLEDFNLIRRTQEEAVMKNTVGCKLRHIQDIDFLAIEHQLLKESSHLQRKGFIIQIEVSAKLQGQNI